MTGFRYGDIGGPDRPAENLATARSYLAQLKRRAAIATPQEAATIRELAEIHRNTEVRCLAKLGQASLLRQK